MKDLSTSCVLAIAFGASVCALHEDSWKVKVYELVTLRSLDPRRFVVFLGASNSVVDVCPKLVVTSGAYN